MLCFLTLFRFLLFFVPNSVNEEEASSQPSVAMVFEVVGGEEVKRRCTHRQSTILAFFFALCVLFCFIAPYVLYRFFAMCVWSLLCMVFALFGLSSFISCFSLLLFLLKRREIHMSFSLDTKARVRKEVYDE